MAQRESTCLALASGFELKHHRKRGRRRGWCLECLQTVCLVPLSTCCNIASWLCPVGTGNGDVCREHLGLVAAFKSVKCVDYPPPSIKQLKEQERVSCVTQSSEPTCSAPDPSSRT